MCCASKNNRRSKRGYKYLCEWKKDEVVAEFRISMLKIKYICALVKNGMDALSKRYVDLSLEEKILNCLKSLRYSFQAVVEILFKFLRLLWAQFAVILQNA